MSAQVTVGSHGQELIGGCSRSSIPGFEWHRSALFVPNPFQICNLTVETLAGFNVRPMEPAMYMALESAFIFLSVSILMAHVMDAFWSGS